MHPIHDELEGHQQHDQHPKYQHTSGTYIRRNEPQAGHEGDGGQQHAESGDARGQGEEDI